MATNANNNQLSIKNPSPEPPEHLLVSPSVPESVTSQTDDDYPANATATPEPPNSRQTSHSRSNSRENSYSYSPSQMTNFWKLQEKTKQTGGYSSFGNLHALPRPENLPPIIPAQTSSTMDEDDEREAEEFERIRMDFARQESSSRDKRRTSVSSKNSSIFSLHNRTKPSKKRNSKKLSKIYDDGHPKSNKNKNKKGRGGGGGGGRGRSQTHHINTSPSPNKMNLPPSDNIQRWDTHSGHNTPPEITPSPLSTIENRDKLPTGLPHADAEPIDYLPDIGSPEDLNSPAKSSPYTYTKLPRSHSDVNLSSGKDPSTGLSNVSSLESINSSTAMAHLTSSSANDLATKLISGGSQTPGPYPVGRQRSRTIRADGHKPGLSHGLSTVSFNLEDIEDDIKSDLFISSDDEDDEYDDMEDDDEEEEKKAPEKKKHYDPSSELVFETATQSIMVSCGDDTKEVFNHLRTVCLALKKSQNLPFSLPFDDKMLKYPHVEAFLELLGFLKVKKQSKWTCFKHTRIKVTLIDCAILECHKCVRAIQKHEKTRKFIEDNRKKRKNSLTKPSGARKSMGQISPNLGDLGIIKQSLTNEESIVISDDEPDAQDANDSIQLYELIWGITHNNNDDQAAKDVLLLCYPLVTTSKQILLCLEARFFSDDHDGRITVSNVSDKSNNNSYSPSSQLTFGSHTSFPGFGDGIIQKGHVRGASSHEFDKQQMKFDKIESSYSTQNKVINFIKHWMDGYWDKDWDGNAKLINHVNRLKQSIKRAYTSERSKEYYEEVEIKKGLALIRVLDKTMDVQKRKRHFRKVLGDESASLKPKRKNSHHKRSTSKWNLINRSSSKQIQRIKTPKELVDVRYDTIAEQLTLLQFNLFKKIHPRECLKQSWKDKQKNTLAPNITAYIDAFNRLTKWIQSSILVAPNVKVRGRIIKKWIKVEEELYKLRNFQGICAVYCALASSPVYKLKEAWSYVSKKHITEHHKIKIIMKSNGNWRNLRRLQLETHPPMLPYFGMFAQDLIVIEETTSNRTNDGSINWDALWRVKTAIDKHLIYQNTSYTNLKEDAIIQRWMNKELTMSGKLDDEWVYQVSQTVNAKDKRELGKTPPANNNSSSSPKKKKSFRGKRQNQTSQRPQLDTSATTSKSNNLTSYQQAFPNLSHSAGQESSIATLPYRVTVFGHTTPIDNAVPKDSRSELDAPMKISQRQIKEEILEPTKTKLSNYNTKSNKDNKIEETVSSTPKRSTGSEMVAVNTRVHGNDVLKTSQDMDEDEESKEQRGPVPVPQTHVKSYHQNGKDAKQQNADGANDLIDNDFEKCDYFGHIYAENETSYSSPVLYKDYHHCLQLSFQWLPKYQYNENLLLYRLYPPYRLINTLRLLLSPSLIQPIHLIDVIYSLNSFNNQYHPVTCPSTHQSTSNVVSSMINTTQKESGNNRRRNNQPPHDDGSGNGGGDKDGDGEDEKKTNMHDHEFECVNCQRLSCVVKQQQIIIQQLQYQIDQEQKKFQQEQLVSNTLRQSHQALIQQFSHHTCLMSLSIQTIHEVNQLRAENKDLKHKNRMHQNAILSKKKSKKLIKPKATTILQPLTINVPKSRLIPPDIESTEETKSNDPASTTEANPSWFKEETKPIAEKQRNNNEYYYEPSTFIRAHKNIYISRSFTSQLIPSKTEMSFDKVNCHKNHKNKCECDALYSWLDIDIAMQFNDTKYQTRNSKRKIFNIGLVNDETKDDLFCIIEAVEDSKNGKKSQREYPWKMRDKLYTRKMMMDECKLNSHPLPIPVRNTQRFIHQSRQKSRIQETLKNSVKLRKLIDGTKWPKIKVFSKLNNKKRNVLYMMQCELKKELKNNPVFKMKQIMVIPILSFRNKQYEIHHMMTLNINGSDVGISMIYDDESQKIIITGIHMNKSMICKQHQWISLQHLDECHCFDNFNTFLDDLKIGNVDVDEEMQRLKRDNKVLIREKENWTKMRQMYYDGYSAESPSPDVKNGYESTSSSNTSIR